jgi:hypothetical protein
MVQQLQQPLLGTQVRHSPGGEIARQMARGWSVTRGHRLLSRFVKLDKLRNVVGRDRERSCVFARFKQLDQLPGPPNVSLLDNLEGETKRDDSLDRFTLQLGRILPPKVNVFVGRCP